MNQFECIVYVDDTQPIDKQFVCETSWDTFSAISYQAALEAALADAAATFSGTWTAVIKKSS